MTRRYAQANGAVQLMLWILVAALLPGYAQSAESGNEATASGQELAMMLRTLSPVEDSEITGVLRIKHGHGKPAEEIAVSCSVKLRADGWDSVYQTAAGRSVGAEKLIIKHYTNAPSVFLFAESATNDPTPPNAVPLTADQLDKPLAGSDFSLNELGLDFLFWPDQTRLHGEMRLGEPCFVLESRQPSGQRIKSWIAKSSVDEGVPGLLVAESYDTRNELVKEFSLGGGSFKKVNGRWTLEQMKIRSVRRGSETVLKFNLPAGKQPK